MSAFLVSNDTLNVIVTYGVTIGITIDMKPPHEVFKTLFRANCRSLKARYGITYSMKALGYTFQPKEVSLVQVLKSCRCLNYQSCEYNSWGKSKAYEYINMIENHLNSIGITSEHPDYMNAKWDM